MSESTARCFICGNPYKVYAFTVADQSACPSCVKKAEQNMHLNTPREAVTNIDEFKHSSFAKALRNNSRGG